MIQFVRLEGNILLVLLNRYPRGKWYSVVLKSGTERRERNVVCRNSKTQEEQLDAGQWYLQHAGRTKAWDFHEEKGIEPKSKESIQTGLKA